MIEMTRQHPRRAVARTHWFASRYCSFHRKPCMAVGADLQSWAVTFANDPEFLIAENEDRFGLQLVHDAKR